MKFSKLVQLPEAMLDCPRNYNSPDTALAKTNFQKKRKILKVVKRSALRKARSVPLFNAWRNWLTTNEPAFT